MNILHYNNTSQSFKTFKQKAQAETPDLIHIHGCWSWKAWRVMLWCRSHLKPVVISPEKQLMPWHVLYRYWLCKLPKLLIFQRWMIKNAHAIVAITEQEQQHLLSIGLYPSAHYEESWNDRVVLIPDFQTCNNYTKEDMNALYMALYQKVLDSHSFMVRVRQLSPDSWRKILLHAEEEGILQEIRQGASLLQIAPQAITGIERFPMRGKKNNQPLLTDKALLKPHLLKEYSDEKHADTTDIIVCKVILNFIHELQKGTLSRRHVADLYNAIRFNDYNEKKITQILELLKERKKTARLLQIIHETLGLEEGFIPMDLVNDRGTWKIKKILNKANIQ